MEDRVDLWVIKHGFCGKIFKYFGNLDTEDEGSKIPLRITKY